MSRPAPIPLEDAQARLLGLARPLPVEHLAVTDAFGRYLAQPLAARRTQPAADLSAMDGYAMLPGDTAGPWRIVGESAAGHPYTGELTKGQAVRIATGAVMPEAADVVILQEDLSRDGDAITLTGTVPMPADKHIRRTGLDFTEGAQVLGAGTRIGPAQAALAVSAGYSGVAVHRLPRVAIMDSGDELAADPAICSPHQIPASNGVMLAGLCATVTNTISRIGPVADTMEALAAAFARAEQADIIVTSGGASVGDHDLVKSALEAWGATLAFWRVAIKPGKPILVATRDGPGGKQIILGLPGNPVSSHVTAFLFLLPLLRAMAGAAQPLPSRFAARLAAPVRPGGSRQEFLRAHWDGTAIAPQTIQDSSALMALSASNALIERPANAREGRAGDEVFGYLLENGGIA